MSLRFCSRTRRSFVIGWVIALPIVLPATALLASEPISDSPSNSDLPQIQLPLDIQPGESHRRDRAESAAVEAGRQPIVAPLPPALLTAAPVLAGIWATHRYRSWRRRIMR